MKTRLLFPITAILLASCREAPPPSFPGYAEGEYIRLAAPFAGQLATLAVRRGDRVDAGAPLFTLERESERAAREEAAARVARAAAQKADLGKGRRPEEIAALTAQLSQAEAMARLSSQELARVEPLVAKGFLSPAKRDEARAAVDRDRARVAEIGAQLRIANLAARPDALAAAEADTRAADQQLAQADWRLGQKSQRAPAGGLVADTLFTAGEWVPAGAPVVTLLPPENIKVRFFVDEKRLGSLKVGQAVTVSCDGCAAGIAATIAYIAPQAEFTAPLIYSKDNRASLVFLIEARPAPADAAKLHPGQPVEVRL